MRVPELADLTPQRFEPFGEARRRRAQVREGAFRVLARGVDSNAALERLGHEAEQVLGGGRVQIDVDAIERGEERLEIVALRGALGHEGAHGLLPLVGAHGDSIRLALHALRAELGEMATSGAGNRVTEYGSTASGYVEPERFVPDGGTMSRQIIATEAAPAAVGPYSQAIRVGAMLFTSGQIAIDPATGTMSNGDVAEQAEQALRNLAAVLEAGGSSMERVIKTTVFLTTMDHFKPMNAVYERHFGASLPARSCVAAAELPLGALFEIEAIADAS